MKNYNHQGKKFNSLLILGIIWFLGAVCDRIWFALDRSIPAWDQADYLTGTLNYWQALRESAVVELGLVAGSVVVVF